VEITDAPSNGDVLITSEGGRHLLSIFPYPHRLTISEYPLAFQIAKKWADANNVNIWRRAEGELKRLPRD
jgi:hypothetical protein